ncbi:GntR family transcriptional regulator [Mesorhizobium sp. WSM3882]|uniref:GntR family transcriptional regulator n=1 Tax=Mesorhizobium sp. WSM3882 TaxID=2029407 RepID=UPI000BD1D0D2|nr:GntR family transcriptional regulator [Mesorhizobium sp. WSM3882]PBB28980.1 hypothetical protein CK214_28005 [Mesorhizobium sp. WSM3882]
MSTVDEGDSTDGREQVFDTRSKRGRPRGTGTQMVYETLREEILTLVARPGDHLEETQLERRFGVSRTPIREALIRLGADRLVRFSANRGHFVELINLDDTPRLFEALDLYQGAVFRLAALRRTDRHLAALRKANADYLSAARNDDHRAMTEINRAFHGIVGDAAGNSFLLESYSNILNMSLRLTYLMFENADQGTEQPFSYYQRIYDEHQDMIALLEAKDGDALDAISQRHTKLFASRVSEFMLNRIPLRSKPQQFQF